MPLKIIAFPFAGGNQYSFNFLKKDLDPEKIVWKTLEYPGRGKRFREPLLYSIHDIVEDAFDKIIPEIKEEEHYIIYGHSMGALTGYLICHKLEQHALKKPLKLVVSGREAPEEKVEQENICDLPEEDFWKKISELGGLPDELLKEEKIKTLFEPVLRADFRTTEQYRYTKQKKLSIPIDVFYGTEENMTGDEISGWKNGTTEKVVITPLKGDHFFIQKQHAFFLNYFTNLYTNLIYS